MISNGSRAFGDIEVFNCESYEGKILNRSVFINATGSFFPNAAVDNSQIEAVLGMVNDRPSRSMNIVLGSNQIKTRHYAIDPVTRASTHSNADIATAAINDLLQKNPQLSLSDVGLLCSGTSSSDLFFPSHGQMIQGLLKNLACEVVTTSGVCCSSMAAMKTAFLSVLSGDSDAALVTGSETASKFMRAEFFESENEEKVNELRKNPALAFEHDFLRWMLSDGAGAAYLSHRPNEAGLSLKINWIEGRSYANEEPVCMLAGGTRLADGTIIPWKDLRLSDDSKAKKYAFNVRQDIRQLKDMIPIYSVEKPLSEIKKKRGLRPGDYDWFLPHYSSHYFRETLFNALTKIDMQIPYERWFTALYEKGNVGSASILVFLDELMKQKSLERGQKILGYIPESSRFSVYYFELEVV